MYINIIYGAIVILNIMSCVFTRHPNSPSSVDEDKWERHK